MSGEEDDFPLPASQVLQQDKQAEASVMKSE